MTAPRIWHLISAEYPPKIGGVGDYTVHLAAELAAANCEVHVWTIARGSTSPTTPGVTVHGLPHFGFRGRLLLSRMLKIFPAPRTLLIQYVPHAYGWRAMNLPFALWVLERRILHGDDVRIMFHEVAYPWVRRPWKHNLIAAVNRLMAWLLIKASPIVYTSTTAWTPILLKLGARHKSIIWLSIMATLPAEPPAELVRTIRETLPRDRPIVGHFGTYGLHNQSLLTPILRNLLNRKTPMSILLIGNGGVEYREALLAENPEWASHITARGRQSLVDLAASLRACDLAIQPYLDGANSRRTSLLAALLNRIAVISNIGANTDPIWITSGIVLAANAEPAPMVEAVEALLADPVRRAAVAEAGHAFYRSHFDTHCRLAILLGSPAASE